MRSAFVLLLALATPAIAEELYLPVYGEGRELRVVNPTRESAQITIELLEGALPVRSRQFTLAAGESMEWRDAAAELFGVEGSGVLRITCAACEATAATAATSRRRSVRSGTPAPVTTPKTVTLTPSKDNTLFESASGSNSNGAGVHLFSGMTAGFVRRRALVAFDVASQIPAGSQITRVTLRLRISKSISGQRQFALHRVSKDWGQGTSNAGVFRDGTGAAATNGDATWVHASRPNSLWTNRGGDFTEQPDAETVADFGELTFDSSAALIARVQSWVDQPSTNFGWILIGDESEFTTAKVFDSRESGDSAARPTLTIEYLAR